MFVPLYRILILALSTILSSVCTLIMGAAQQVWQLIVLRFGLAIG